MKTQTKPKTLEEYLIYKIVEQIYNTDLALDKRGDFDDINTTI